MSRLSKEIMAWHLGTTKIVIICLLASISFSLLVSVLAEMVGTTITPEDGGMFALMGSIFGATIGFVASREVRKTKECLKSECGVTRIKILATGKYVCQVCGSESDPDSSDPNHKPTSDSRGATH